MARMTIETDGGRKYLFRVPTTADSWHVAGHLPIQAALGSPDGKKPPRPAKLDELSPLDLREIGERFQANPETVTEEELRAYLWHGANNANQLIQLTELADRLLARCSIRPKLILETPEDVPDGQECLEELDPAWRLEVAYQLDREAGLGMFGKQGETKTVEGEDGQEVPEAVGPTSGTAEGS